MTILGEPIPCDPDDPLATYHQDEYLRQLFLTSQNLSLTQRDGAIQNYDKAGNLCSKYVVFTSNGVANTEDVVTHKLGRIPVGYIVVKQDKAGIVYDSTTTWTTSTIALKSSVASVAWTLMVF
jgi:hypothetical protein